MKTQPHYIYLSKEDKTKIIKQAQAKQLSLSTYVNIIAKWYNVVNPIFNGKYYKKGNNRIMIKPRNENNLQDLDLTNLVYLFLHNKALKDINPDAEKLNLYGLNKRIQSESDKTLDNNWNLNQVIRTNYIAQRKLRA